MNHYRYNILEDPQDNLYFVYALKHTETKVLCGIPIIN